MELLFKREQTTGIFGRVVFRLWGKLELSEDEQALIRRYRFNETVLIGADDWEALLKRAAVVGVIAFIMTTALLVVPLDLEGALLAGLMAGVGAGTFYINEKRETIYVRDLLYGRHFKCASVVDLARKEAWLEGACGIFRQVMESAKHWDGVERHTIEPLPKEKAKELILRAA
jgi:hypothetical protein